jgi:hypothetical protein
MSLARLLLHHIDLKIKYLLRANRSKPDAAIFHPAICNSTSGPGSAAIANDAVGSPKQRMGISEHGLPILVSKAWAIE